ncbi:hypothetical protein ACS0TY_013453 [Phlomoides rotata]
MAAAALQQTRITFHCPSPPSSHPHSKPTTKLSLSSNLKIKSLRSPNRGGGARMADTAAGSYADVATSNNTLEQTYVDIEKIFSHEHLLNFFADPTIGDAAEKCEIVDEVAKPSELQPHVANFLNILVDMKRINLIGKIAKEFEVVYNKLTATELAIVTSVVQLESQHLAQLAKGVQRLTGAKNVRIKTVLDPSLLAGFTIRYGHSGSKLVDMSVKKQLEEIAAQLDIGDIQLAVR